MLNGPVEAGPFPAPVALIAAAIRIQFIGELAVADRPVSGNQRRCETPAVHRQRLAPRSMLQTRGCGADQ